MELTFRKATLEDLQQLLDIRIEALRAANDLDETADMSTVSAQIERYYTEALPKGQHDAFLIYNGEELIGCGNVSYYEVMPTYCHPSGRKAYISNMYVKPAYRRQGIAREMLNVLIETIQKKGDYSITLEATEMGRPLYQNYGFIPLPDEMELPENRDK